MLKSSGLMAAATLTSRVLGMVREMVYAKFMGDGWVASAFALAFQIPNLFRRLLGEGALTAAFIPIFKEKEKNGTPEELWRAANAVISGLLAVASIITILVMLGITIFLASGYLASKPLPPFSAKNVKDVRALAAKLERPNDSLAPLAQFLTNRLSEASREAMRTRHDKMPSLEASVEQENNLRTNLMNDLNTVIKDFKQRFMAEKVPAAAAVKA